VRSIPTDSLLDRDNIRVINRLTLGFRNLENNIFGQYIILAGMTFLTAGLRFFRLGEWSFWGDEVAWMNFSQIIFDYPVLRWPVSPLLIHQALKFLGTSEFSARVVPALLGVITVPVLYFLVKNIFGSLAALISALLLAISPWHLYWSQNARFYTSLLFFFTLALFVFYFAVEENRPFYLLISLIFWALAFQERRLALMLLPVVAGYFIFLTILPIEKPVGLRIQNVALFFLPLLPLAIRFSQPIVEWSSSWANAFGRINNSPFWIFSGVVYYVGLPLVILSVCGAFYLLVNKNRAALLLSLAAAIPLLTLMVFSLFQYSANRYAFISLPAFIILASVAVKELLVDTQNKTRFLGMGVLMILVLTSLSEDVLYYRYQNGNRADWRAAIEFVKQNKRDGDLVVVADQRVGDYYLPNETIGMWSLEPSRLETYDGSVWIVEDMNVDELYPDLLEWIQSNTQLVAVYDVNVQARNFKMRVYLYEPGKEQVPMTIR
jgi:mannosyltransferase